MSGRYFLDTNVLLYVFDRGHPDKAKRSARLVREAIVSGNGVISYQVVQEFFNVALRRFSPAMGLEDAEDYLSTTLRPLLAIHPSSALIVEALRLRASFKLSWYDSLIVAAALEAKCNTLFSEDFQHGQRFGGLRIENPFL